MGLLYRYRWAVILVLLSLVFFMLGNGILSLTNPDEVFYSQTAKEMAQQKTWNVPYLFGHPQFEKPILTYWLLRVAFILFGVSSFGARFFPALFAMIGVIAVYILVFNVYKDEKKAFISSLVLLSAGFYIGLARTVFTDLIFAVFILLSLVSFFLGFIDRKMKAAGIVMFFIFAGLAVLTKGPLGFLLPFLAILLFLGVRRELRFLFCRHSVWGFLAFILIAVPWYALMFKKFGDSFTREFFYNDHFRRVVEAEHKTSDRWYFYPLSMLGCMFPWSVYVFFALPVFLKRLRQKLGGPLNLFLFCWIFVVFAVFQMAHSKLTSYILPLFPALAIITGDFIYTAMASNKRKIFVPSVSTWLVLLAAPVGVFVAALKYPMYLPSMAFVYWFIFFYAILLFIMLLFLMKKRWMVYLCLLSFQMPVFLFFALSFHKSFDPYVSSEKACEYLLANYKVNNTILSSKSFVRGVRFYTDKEVAVINVNGVQFFSPHPIAYLDSDAKALALLKRQPETYGIVTRSSLADLKRIATDNKFKLDILQIIGNEYIVRIE